MVRWPKLFCPKSRYICCAEFVRILELQSFVFISFSFIEIQVDGEIDENDDSKEDRCDEANVDGVPVSHTDLAHSSDDGVEELNEYLVLTEAFLDCLYRLDDAVAWRGVK